jgi:hypothetical protein
LRPLPWLVWQLLQSGVSLLLWDHSQLIPWTPEWSLKGFRRLWVLWN